MRTILVSTCSVILASLFCISFDVPTAAAVSNVDGVWSALSPGDPAPSARREYAALYDRAQGRYIVFAGFTNEQGEGYFLFNEVWTLALDGTPSWSQLAIPGDIPGGRHSPQWGYDPANNRVLVFGGYGSHYPGSPYAYLNDVWELKLDGAPNWNEIFPSGSPPAGRLAGAAVYDVLHQRFVGFGGTVGLPVDTWQLDLSDQLSWSTVETSLLAPPGGYGMTSIFDPVRNRMLIFGGSLNDGYYGTHNDTWELDLQPEVPIWRQLNPVGPLPLARRTLASVFDPRRDRMVVFGGWDGTPGESAFLNDTWALSLSSADGAWTQLSPEGPVPVGRDAMAAAYDPRGDRMVTFGGWSATGILGDTQFLTWDDGGEPATATSTGEFDNGVIQLEWNTQNTTSAIGAVYRREANTPWTSFGTVEADGQGVVSFEDNAVTPGHEYGYQIVVSSEVGNEFVGEVWVSVPTPTHVGTPNAVLALQPSPNPAGGLWGVSFALTGDDPARLEMFNVRGQRIFSRDVGAYGAGAHRLEVGNAKDYPSGVYYLRITQSGRSATSRVVLVR